VFGVGRECVKSSEKRQSTQELTVKEFLDAVNQAGVCVKLVDEREQIPSILDGSLFVPPNCDQADIVASVDGEVTKTGRFTIIRQPSRRRKRIFTLEDTPLLSNSLASIPQDDDKLNYMNRNMSYCSLQSLEEEHLETTVTSRSGRKFMIHKPSKIDLSNLFHEDTKKGRFILTQQ
jgi:hypothetical protein